jgi:hypothetical protein
VRSIAAEGRSARGSVSFGLGRLGQHILNLMNVSGARAAERRQLLALDRRGLDDCGLTPADVDLGLPDMFAADFRVAHLAERRAA